MDLNNEIIVLNINLLLIFCCQFFASLLACLIFAWVGGKIE